MESNQSNKKQAVPLHEELSGAAIATMKKAVQEQTASRLQSGQSPEEILLSLSKSIGGVTDQIASEKVAKPGSMIGLEGSILNVLSNMVTGGNKSLNPFSPQTVSRGEADARQILNLAINMGEANRRSASAERKAPGEVAKSQSEILKLAQSQAETLGDTRLLELLKSDSGNNSPNDPAYDPAFRKQYKELDMKRTFENRKELDNYTRSLVPVMNDLMKFQDIAEKLPDYKGGIINQMIARADSVKKVIEADPVALRFNSAIDAGLGNFAKSGGDSGVLSNQDLDRIKGVLGKTNIPFNTKVQVYTDMTEKFLAQYDTRKELANDPNHEKKFPIIKKSRERYEKNRELLKSKEKVSNKLTVENLFEGLE